MDLLYFVGSRKTRRESALATTESALRRSAPGPWILALTSIILHGWNEAKMAPFGEMLYTRLERLEAKLEIDLNLQILEISCVIASMMPGINGPSRKHDISRWKKISPSTQDLDLPLFEDPGNARQFKTNFSSYYPR